jgi:hypothetical protein
MSLVELPDEINVLGERIINLELGIKLVLGLSHIEEKEFEFLLLLIIVAILLISKGLMSLKSGQFN